MCAPQEGMPLTCAGTRNSAVSSWSQHLALFEYAMRVRRVFPKIRLHCNSNANGPSALGCNEAQGVIQDSDCKN